MTETTNVGGTNAGGNADIAETDIANVEMAAAWDGDDGNEWADKAGRYEASQRFVVEHLESAQALRSDDVVLDIGCGNGVSTVSAARRVPEGRAFGVDLSTRMLARAAQRARDEGVTNVTFARGDAG